MMMKKYGRAMVVALALGASGARAGPTLVTVDLQTPVVRSFLGLGIQWDPYDRYSPTAAQWQMMFARLDHCRPAFFRVMLGTGNYCTGFDAAGQPQYVWNADPPESGRLRDVYRILDYAQQHQVAVFLGEWWSPGDMKAGTGKTNVGLKDPRWAALTADFITYLRDTKKYTCIKLYNCVNEPVDQFPSWAVAVQNLRAELDGRGIKLPIMGPDIYDNSHHSSDKQTGPEAFASLDRAAREFPQRIGAWEVHWYAQDKEVLAGAMEQVLRAKRALLVRADPQLEGKPLFLGETGLIDGRCNGDQQPRVRTFEYGVLMADYVAQVARAGWMGQSAWDMDDAMHGVSWKHAPTPPDDKTLKVWGFWNTQGPAMGHPEDQEMRPWFYAWSLLTRLFPPGCQIVQTTSPAERGFRATAMHRVRDGQADLSILLVNDLDTARTVRLQVPGAGRGALQEYHYFAADRPVDAGGFAVPARRGVEADLAAGLEITLPARGVVFLTTLAESP